MKCTPVNNNTPQDSTSFETALSRLEEILERMNGGTISLDESLKLYEEADQLIAICNKRLNEAERKIEILVKNRSGELAIGSDDKPLVQDYKIPSA
ncbi:Exodeoxyribonuclease 7 small subunit [Candidatus Protochlamydia naegleriophila]|uniref:Exodeoxyribonuclease 7 small subunit n=1 Tax=Candidatus Protochlamydia naegleriophila TaxID=389348 RepID=A0A0U5EQY8_9BACT|nr:Exodeoxyribonuclease 7 small subunit [Candidatus Protochlamydia naegleriophila]